MKFQMFILYVYFFYFYMLKKIHLKKLKSLSLFVICITIPNKMQDICQQKENYICFSQKFYFRTFLAFLLQLLLFLVFLIQFTKDFFVFFSFSMDHIAL